MVWVGAQTAARAGPSRPGQRLVNNRAGSPALASYEIIPRQPDHDEQLFALYAAVFGEERAQASRARWAWQYTYNPLAATPAVWAAREAGGDGALLGQMASMPVTLWWGDREVRASWGMDFFVRKQAEGRGLGPMLVRTWIDSVDAALAIGLTPPAHALYRRLGFRDVGAVPFFLKVLDHGAVARRRLGKLPGTLVAPLLRVGLALRTGRWSEPRPGVEVRPVSTLGAEHDALWESARGSYAMCVRRDAAYLRWKYLEAPHRQYELLEARRDGAVVGLAVSRHEHYRGLRLGWLIDAFADASDAAARVALVSAVLGRFREAGVARVQAYAMSAALQDTLRQFGFFAGPSTALFCVKTAADAQAPFDDPGRWHVTFGDSDQDR